jgi:hypothetical protein
MVNLIEMYYVISEAKKGTCITVCLLNNAVSSSDHIRLTDRIINKMEAAVVYLWYYYGICLQGLRKITKQSCRIAGS